MARLPVTLPTDQGDAGRVSTAPMIGSDSFEYDVPSGSVVLKRQERVVSHESKTIISRIVLAISLGSALLFWFGPPRPLSRAARIDGDETKNGAKPTVEYLNRNGRSNMPFSEAVRVGDLLILSGKIGTDPSGKLVPGGIKAETKQTMDNIRAALEAYGSSLDDVVKSWSAPQKLVQVI